MSGRMTESHRRSAAVPFLLGLLLLVWALYDSWDIVLLAIHGEVTVASIEGANSERKDSRFSTVRYSVRGFDYSVKGYVKGYTTHVRYLPKQPVVGCVDNFVNMWGILILKALAGSLIAVWGAQFVRNADRAETEERLGPQKPHPLLQEPPSAQSPHKWED